MNDKRASRRICVNCKQLWNNSAMHRRGKRYICPKCAQSKRRISVLRRKQARVSGPEKITAREKAWLQ